LLFCSVGSLDGNATITLSLEKAKRQITLISELCLFTRNSVVKAKVIVGNLEEPAILYGVGGFAEWAMFTLQALRIELRKSYRQTIDILSEMPGIFEEIGLTRLPRFSVLRDWFETITMSTYRAFLG